jgi:hypothetical protein
MSNPWFLESLAKDRQREFLAWGGRRVVGSPHRAASPHAGQGPIGNLTHWVRSIPRANTGATDKRTRRRRDAFELPATSERLASPVGPGR